MLSTPWSAGFHRLGFLPQRAGLYVIHLLRKAVRRVISSKVRSPNKWERNRKCVETHADHQSAVLCCLWAWRTCVLTHTRDRSYREVRKHQRPTSGKVEGTGAFINCQKDYKLDWTLAVWLCLSKSPRVTCHLARSHAWERHATTLPGGPVFSPSQVSSSPSLFSIALGGCYHEGRQALGNAEQNHELPVPSPGLGADWHFTFLCVLPKPRIEAMTP